MSIPNFHEIAANYRKQLNALTVGVPPIPSKRSENEITDENQSVKWNRERITTHNALVESHWNKRHLDAQEIYGAFQTACINELTKEFSLPAANVIWDKAYEDGHYNGFETIAEKIVDLYDFSLALSNAAASAAIPTA